ncbi:septum formation initiator family protein [Clostridium sp. AF32-12BH]|uniref:FtsB family cell division protein n=2 Tax=unclassified Clostridium TaxID=2614128 RepID=UPI00325AE5B4
MHETVTKKKQSKETKKLVRNMKARGTGRRKRKERLGNRLTMIGITVVVLSMAVIVNVKNTSMEKKVMEYQAKEESLMRQVESEKKRSAELEERRVYVQTKQYIEEVAKQKLGLVKPDEILLKPAPKNN